MTQKRREEIFLELRNSPTTCKEVDTRVLDYRALKTGDTRTVCHLKRENKKMM